MDLAKAYRLVIDDLDAEMEENPDQQLANVSNFLEDRLSEMVI